MTIETLAHTDSLERLPHSDLNWEDYEACKSGLIYYEGLRDYLVVNCPENEEKILDIEDTISAHYTVLADIVGGAKVNYQSII